MFRSRAILFLLLFFTQPLLAATALIPLQHRPASELLPAAQALLDEGETLVALDNQLLIRASLERINELRSILSQLDVPPRQLLISLDTRTTLPSRYRTDTSASQVRVLTAGTPEPLQIRASEGQPVFLGLTRNEPRLGFSTDLTGAPYLHSEDSVSGFDLSLVVRISSEDQVQLDVHARRATQDPSSYGAQQVLQGQTRLTGRLGDWIEVTTTPAPPAGTLAARPLDAPVRIRVDTLPPASAAPKM